MLNFVWIALMTASVILGCIHHTLSQVVSAITESAKTGATFALGLIGIMALWLGIMRLAEESGLIRVFSRVAKPLMSRLFPSVPKNHPAMDGMMMNISANMLGIGNAATPFGLRAMESLAKLNNNSIVASDAMCLFLAINTSSVQIIPASAIAILALSGDPNPTSIIVPSLIATSFSTLIGILSAKLFAKIALLRNQNHELASHK